MSVLLLRLAGPMQSWGTQSRFSHRDTALRVPVWVRSLGRKSFVPSLPVAAGIDDRKLIEVLKSAPWSGRNREKHAKQLRFVVERPYGQGEPRPDVPLSFVSRDRKFA